MYTVQYGYYETMPCVTAPSEDNDRNFSIVDIYSILRLLEGALHQLFRYRFYTKEGIA